MTATVDRNEVDRFVHDVAALLPDLDDDEREEVLADLRLHAAEVAAETGEPLVDVLGSPERFAAELRTAAGLEAVAPDAGTGRRERVRAASRRLADHRWVRPVVDFLPELRPAWWVARGVLLAVALAGLTGAGELDQLAPVPSVGGSRLLGLVVAAALVVSSVRWGRRSPSSGWTRRALVAAGAGALLGLWMLLVAGSSGAATHAVAEYVEVPPSSATSNLYAYLPDGTPIESFLLFDDGGRPFELSRTGYSRSLEAEFEAAIATDLDGRPVTNLYPREVRFFGPSFFDETGGRVEEEPPPPIVAVPRLVDGER